jgi:multidrug resistance efflux pump
MKRSTVLVIVGMAAIGVLSWGARRGSDGAAVAAAAAAPAATPAEFVAGPGAVEALSEEIRVSAQIGGRLDQVLVDEGDRVTAGQVLAVIENRDYRARVASADAELRLREAELRRLVNGARPQERREVEAALAEADAVLQHARTEQERNRQLLRVGVIAQNEVDGADRAARVAQARVDAARQHADLVNADPREEDVARAQSAIALAQARLEEARAELDKTFVRAPIGGVILRRRCKAGESVSTQFESPIVTMADDRVRRVRVDVDETDVAAVAVGQAAYVTADGFGDRHFAGRVVRVGRLLGRKNVRTDEPTERVDTKVLETLVQLEDGRELPLGLRVQAFIARRASNGGR